MEATKRPWRADGVTVRAKTSGYAVADCGVGCKGPREANAALIVKAVNCHDKLVGALREIAKGEGRYSMDQLTHAANTIEDMKALAVAALAECD